MSSTKVKLENLAKKYGIEIEDKGNGHYQIKGPLLVNYYPLSSKRTAYVKGTTKGKRDVTPEQAVNMCFTAPPACHSSEKAKRSKKTRAARKRLIKKGVVKCFWCKTPLTLDNSTLEHIVPIHRGGLDNENNLTLACSKCNEERGSNMPEIEVVRGLK